MTTCPPLTQLRRLTRSRPTWQVKVPVASAAIGKRTTIPTRRVELTVRVVHLTALSTVHMCRHVGPGICEKRPKSGTTKHLQTHTENKIIRPKCSFLHWQLFEKRNKQIKAKTRTTTKIENISLEKVFNTWKNSFKLFFVEKKRIKFSNKIDLTREKNQKVLKVLKVVYKKKT